MTAPVRVRPLDAIAWAMLKAVSRGRPSSSSSTFCGFMSRWTMPRRCAYSRAAASAAPRARISLSGRRGARNALLQVAASDELHDDERRARFGVLAHVEDGNDVRVAQAGGRARLTPKALEEFRVFGKLRMEQLDGDGSVEQRVLGLPDHAHATAGNLADQPIAAAEHPPGALDAQSEPPSSGSTSRSPWRRRISRSAWA